MMKAKIRPQPWWVVGLALLPALFMLQGVGYWSVFPEHWSLWHLAFVVPAVAGVWIAARRRSLNALPVWSFIALGVLLHALQMLVVALWTYMLSRSSMSFIFFWVIRLGWLIRLILLIAVIIVILRQVRAGKRGRAIWGWGLLAGGLALSVVPRSFLLSPVASWVLPVLSIIVALFLVRKHGILAGLLLLPAGAFMVYAFSESYDFVLTFSPTPQEYALRDSGWLRILEVSGPWLLLVVAPLLVLRARSRWGQAAGLVLPPLGHYLATHAVLAYYGMSDGGVAFPMLIIALYLAGFAIWAMRASGSKRPDKTLPLPPDRLTKGEAAIFPKEA